MREAFMKASNVKREKFMGSVFLTVATSCFVLIQELPTLINTIYFKLLL